MDVLGSSVSESFETKSEIHKMFFSLFLSATLYTFVSIDRSNIFICLLFCSLSTSTCKYLCYNNDIIVKNGAGQEIQAIEISKLSDFSLPNNPNTVIWPTHDISPLLLNTSQCSEDPLVY